MIQRDNEVRILNLAILCAFPTIFFSIATAEPAIVIEKLHEDDYISGTAMGVMKQHKVIRSYEVYREELSVYSNAAEAKLDINFSNNIILLIDMGQRSTGGYSISLGKTITTTNKFVKINVIYSTCAGGPITNSVTNPYAMYLIPTQKSEVLIQEDWINKCS